MQLSRSVVNPGRLGAHVISRHDPSRAISGRAVKKEHAIGLNIRLQGLVTLLVGSARECCHSTTCLCRKLQAIRI